MLRYQAAVPTTTSTTTKSSRPPRSPRGSAPVSSARRVCVSLTNSLVDAVTTRNELQERRSTSSSVEYRVQSCEQFQEESFSTQPLSSSTFFCLIFLFHLICKLKPLIVLFATFRSYRFRPLSETGNAMPGYTASQSTNQR